MRVGYLSYTKVAFLTRRCFIVLQFLKNKVFDYPISNIHNTHS